MRTIFFEDDSHKEATILKKEQYEMEDLKYSRTSMARTSLGTWKLFDMGSSSH